MPARARLVLLLQSIVDDEFEILFSAYCFFTLKEQTGLFKERFILCGHPYLLSVAFSQGKICTVTSKWKNQP